MCDSHSHFPCISKVNYSSLIQGCNVIPTNMSNFQPLEVVGRCIKTQLHESSGRKFK